jgi:DNA-binding MarR family transcriptional regulator
MSGPVHRPRVDLSDPAQREIALRVGRAWKEMRRGAGMSVLRDHFFGVGADALEPGQMDALDLLVQRDAWRMGDLAEALRIDPSSATRAVQRLVRAGLAERSASSEDKRVVMVSATRAGRQRHADAARRRSEALARILAAYEPSELETLVELLERFVDAIDQLVAELGPDRILPARRQPPTSA